MVIKKMQNPEPNTSFNGTSPTIGAILQVTRKGGVLKLIRAAYRSAPAVFHLPAHFKLMRVMKDPALAPLLARRPKLPYKYLYRPYLVQGFTRKTRLDILIHHYSYLTRNGAEGFFAKILDQGYTLWQDNREGGECSITLGFPIEWEHDYEGDLLLTFRCNGEPVYAITFTLAEGRSLCIDAPQAILVTAIQGTAGKSEAIRNATKCYLDLSPPMLLVSAAEGIGLALKIGMLAGIGLDHQVQKQTWGDDRFIFDYDKFWTRLIGERNSDIFYLNRIPPALKSIDEISAKHRKKTLLRRDIRLGIQEAVKRNFEAHCLKPAVSL